MRSIDPTPFAAYMGRPPAPGLGVKPGLLWIPISALRVDPTYQREIARNGSRNVGKIAKNFDWSLFGIVVVANIGEGLFAIVDGQHRTLAAALRGVDEVPCIIIQADPAKQARAFAAINGAVTAISPLAIFAAEVAAGDERAIAVRDACAKAGVSICRYPVPANTMRPGETLAIGALQRCFATYGPDHLTLALKCITTGKNTGMVKAPVIRAICHVLEAERSWCSPEYRLISVMERFEFAKELAAAEVRAKRNRRLVSSELALALFDFLDGEIGA